MTAKTTGPSIESLSPGTNIRVWPGQKRGPGAPAVVKHAPHQDDYGKWWVQITGPVETILVAHTALSDGIPERELATLKAIYQEWSDAGTGVTLRCIADRAGYSATTAGTHTQRLVERGLVDTTVGRSGSIRPSKRGINLLVTGARS